MSEVGTHRGHHSWPQFKHLGTYDSGSVRRGFMVFTRNCGNCHGKNKIKKYFENWKINALNCFII